MLVLVREPYLTVRAKNANATQSVIQQSKDFLKLIKKNIFHKILKNNVLAQVYTLNTVLPAVMCTLCQKNIWKRWII